MAQRAILSVLRTFLALTLLASTVQAQPEEKTPKAPPDPNRFIFLPSLAVIPFGIDQIGLQQAAENHGFFGMQPELLLAKGFATALGTPIRMKLAYRLTWSEYFEQSSISRTIQQALLAGFSMPWTGRLSTDVDFKAFFKIQSGSEIPTSNILLLTPQVGLWTKIVPTFHLKAAYQLRFIDFLDFDLPVETAPSVLSSFDFVPLDPYGNPAGVQSSLAYEDAYVAQHLAVVGMKYEPFPKTAVTFDYKYAVAHYANTPLLDIGGHYFEFSLKQGMPWKGGELNLSDMFMIFTTDKTLIGGSVSDQDDVNMLSVNFDQRLNKFLTLQGVFRYQSKRTALALIQTLDNNTTFYLGLKVGF